MADFCKQCSEYNFGEDYGDFKIGSNSEDELVQTGICEGCGPTILTIQGICISENCLLKHGKVNE